MRELTASEKARVEELLEGLRERWRAADEPFTEDDVEEYRARAEQEALEESDMGDALRRYASQLPTVLSVSNFQRKLMEAAAELDRLRAARELATRWEDEAAALEARALPENARGVEDRVEDSRSANRLRTRAKELREALS